jgi:hypothetical protein
MWLNIWVGLEPALPNEGTIWFRARMDHNFYTSDEPVWHEAR